MGTSNLSRFLSHGHWLVGGFNPSEKWWSSSVGMIVPFPIIMGKIPAIRINYGLFLVQKPYKNPEKNPSIRWIVHYKPSIMAIDVTTQLRSCAKSFCPGRTGEGGARARPTCLGAQETGSTGIEPLNTGISTMISWENHRKTIGKWRF